MIREIEWLSIIDMKCTDCGCELEDGLTTRCYKCWDEYYFPGINDGFWIRQIIKKLLNKFSNKHGK